MYNVDQQWEQVVVEVARAHRGKASCYGAACPPPAMLNTTYWTQTSDTPLMKLYMQIFGFCIKGGTEIMILRTEKWSMFEVLWKKHQNCNFR